MTTECDNFLDNHKYSYANREMSLIQSSHLSEAHAYDSDFYFSTEGLWRPDYLHILTYAIVSVIYLYVIKVGRFDFFAENFT